MADIVAAVRKKEERYKKYGVASRLAYSVKEVAGLIGKSESAVRKMIANHEIDAYSIPGGQGTWRIPTAEVYKLVPDAAGNDSAEQV